MISVHDVGWTPKSMKATLAIGAREGEGDATDLYILLRVASSIRSPASVPVVGGVDANDVNSCPIQRSVHGTKHPISVIFAGPSKFHVQELETKFWKCCHRLRNVVSRGSVLPGGGVYELLCSEALQRCAVKYEEEAVKVGDNHTCIALPAGCYNPVYAAPQVFRAYSSCLQSMVMAPMHNCGMTFNESLSQLGRLRYVCADDIHFECRNIPEICFCRDFIRNKISK